MSRFLDDLRDSFRSLRRTPAFTAAAVGILALGIGANTAIFSLVQPLFFSRLAISEPERVVRLFAFEADGGLSNSSYPVDEDYRDTTASFSGLAAYCEYVPLHLAIAGAAPARLNGALASSGYFGVLGVAPALGRFFGPADEKSRNPVVVLSDRCWRRTFAPAALAIVALAAGLPPAFRAARVDPMVSLRHE